MNNLAIEQTDQMYNGNVEIYVIKHRNPHRMKLNVDVETETRTFEVGSTSLNQSGHNIRSRSEPIREWYCKSYLSNQCRMLNLGVRQI